MASVILTGYRGNPRKPLGNGDKSHISNRFRLGESFTSSALWTVAHALSWKESKGMWSVLTLREAERFPENMIKPLRRTRTKRRRTPKTKLLWPLFMLQRIKGNLDRCWKLKHKLDGRGRCQPLWLSITSTPPSFSGNRQMCTLGTCLVTPRPG